MGTSCSSSRSPTSSLSRHAPLVVAATTQPGFLRLSGRSGHRDQYRVGMALLHLAGSVEIDLQHHHFRRADLPGSPTAGSPPTAWSSSAGVP